MNRSSLNIQGRSTLFRDAGNREAVLFRSMASIIEAWHCGASLPTTELELTAMCPKTITIRPINVLPTGKADKSELSFSPNLLPIEPVNDGVPLNAQSRPVLRPP